MGTLQEWNAKRDAMTVGYVTQNQNDPAAMRAFDDEKRRHETERAAAAS